MWNDDHLFRGNRPTWTEEWKITTPVAARTPRGIDHGKFLVAIECPDEQRAMRFERYRSRARAVSSRSAFSTRETAKADKDDFGHPRRTA